MKLHVRLIITLLVGILSIFFLSQCFQQYKTISLLNDFSKSNIEQMAKEELRNAENSHQIINRTVQDAISRGEMANLSNMLKLYTGIPEIMEYTVYNSDGEPIDSTSESIVKSKKPLPSDLKSTLLSKAERVSLLR